MPLCATANWRTECFWGISSINECRGEHFLAATTRANHWRRNHFQDKDPDLNSRQLSQDCFSTRVQNIKYNFYLDKNLLSVRMRSTTNVQRRKGLTQFLVFEVYEGWLKLLPATVGKGIRGRVSNTRQLYSILLQKLCIFRHISFKILPKKKFVRYYVSNTERPSKSGGANLFPPKEAGA